MARYLSARKLGITEMTRKYLMYAARTLPKLSRPRKLNGGTFGFNMSEIQVIHDAEDFKGHTCGTAGCILGLMQYKATLDGVPWRRSAKFDTRKLFDLYYGTPGITDLDLVSNKLAARATEHFLKTGVIWFGKRLPPRAA